MKNLYEIQEEYLALINEIESNEGELTPELEQSLKINSSELEKKLRAYVHVISMTKGVLNTIDDEITRLNSLKATKTNLVNRLKINIKDAVVMFGDTGKSGNKVIDYGDMKLYTRKIEKLNIVDDFNILNYLIYKVNMNVDNEKIDTVMNLLNDYDIKITNVPNKTKIKNDLQNGKVIEGCELIKDNTIIIK